jgi:hypothetical protein
MELARDAIESAVADTLVHHATPGGQPHDPEPETQRLFAALLALLVEQAALTAQTEQNAARYLWLRNRPDLTVFTGERVRFKPSDCPHEIEVGQIGRTDLDAAIDAAMTASTPPPPPAQEQT